MTLESHTRLNIWINAFPGIAGATAIVAGATVIIGWIFDVPLLKSLHPSLVSMKANTALAFVLAGISLLLLSSPRAGKQNVTARLLASLVCLIGLLTVAEYAFGWDVGIDLLLFNEPQGTIGTFSPGRMALNTAVSFCLVGIALVTMRRRNRWGEASAHLIAIVVGLFGLFVLLAYVYGLSGFIGFAVYTRMALHTAITFVLLSVGILCLQPNAGIMVLVREGGSAGYMARRLVLAAIAIPVVLGWLAAEGEVRGWYGVQFGEVIAATAYIAILVFLVWTIGRSVIKLDVERKRLEQALLRSEKEFKELFDDAPVGYHELDHEGRIVRVNQTELTSLGYTAGEMKGHFVWEFLDDQEASRQSVLAKLAGTKPPAKGVERLYRRKDLTTITVVSEDVVLRDADGRIAGIRTTLQDVSELVRTQKLLHESEERFKQVAESAEEWIWETDAQGLYTYSSSAVQTILGYHPEEIVGKKHFYDLFASDVRDAFRQAAFAAFARKEAIRGLINPNLHKNGNVVILETSGLPVLDQRGDLVGYRGVDTDITERKHTEEALRDSREHLRLLLDSMAEGAYGVDTNGLCTFVNKAFLRILGYQKEHECLGKHMHTLIHHSHRDGSPYPPNECRMYRSFQTNQAVNGSDEVFWRKDGVAIPVEYWSYPIVMDDVVLGSMATFIDITERKLADQERESLINELKTALENVKTLSGLIPICAHCKKIRDDKGYWNQLEKYLVEHTDANLTHGICPDCVKLHYPGYTENTSPG